MHAFTSYVDKESADFFKKIKPKRTFQRRFVHLLDQLVLLQSTPQAESSEVPGISVIF